jgi:hypothetical protein
MTLPACSAAASSSISVPSGCAPTIDGAYHAGEWGDAACVTLSGSSDPIYVKYSGSTLYLAWPMTPACGCPAVLVFNSDGSMTLDGHQLSLGIFDDPGSTTGDAFQTASQVGTWATMGGSVATGISIANPQPLPPFPQPVTYEIGISFSQLGITAGQAKSVGFGVSHSMGGVWPTGLSVPMAGALQPSNPADWGTLTSSGNWQ